MAVDPITGAIAGQFISSLFGGDGGESLNNRALEQNQALINLQRALMMPGMEAQRDNYLAMSPARQKAIEYLLALIGTAPGRYESPIHANEFGQYGGEVFNVPGMDELPDYLRPVTYTEEDWTRLTEPAMGGVNQFVRETGSAQRADLARRGLTAPGRSSTAGDMLAPGMTALYAQMKAPVTANALSMRKNVEQANKSQAQSNIAGLMSQIQSYTPSYDPSGLGSAMSNQANMYANLGAQYGNLAAANASSMADLGAQIGQLLAYRKANRGNTGGNAGLSGMGANDRPFYG